MNQAILSKKKFTFQNVKFFYILKQQTLCTLPFFASTHTILFGKRAFAILYYSELLYLSIYIVILPRYFLRTLKPILFVFQRLASKLINKTEVERSKRDFEVKKAAYDSEIETARAEAELAYKLQEAKVKQRIKEETQTTDIVERIKLIEVAEQEVARRQCELNAKIKKPAEAEKYRLEIMAEATKVSLAYTFYIFDCYTLKKSV